MSYSNYQSINSPISALKKEEQGKKINQHSAEDAQVILDKDARGELDSPLLPIEKRTLQERAKG